MGKGPLVEPIVFKGRVFFGSLEVGCVSRC